MKSFLKKVFGPIFLSVICGCICGKLVYQVYDRDVSEKIDGKKIYLVQAGAYSTYDNMVDNTSVNSYVYYEDNDGLYKAIIGITEDYDNIEKIKNSYGKDVIISEYYSKDKELNGKLEEYDKKLHDSNDNKDIQSIVLEMLTLYKDNDNSTLVRINSQFLYLYFYVIV